MLADGKGGAIMGAVHRVAHRPRRPLLLRATKGAVLAMTYSVATDYCRKGIRCNVCLPRATPFVDGFLKKNYPGKEAEVSRSSPSTSPSAGWDGPTSCPPDPLPRSDEAGFVTGAAYPIDGGKSAM